MDDIGKQGGGISQEPSGSSSSQEMPGSTQRGPSAADSIHQDASAAGTDTQTSAAGQNPPFGVLQDQQAGPYTQEGKQAQNAPYGQDSYGQDSYGQDADGQCAYGQGSCSQDSYGQGIYDQGTYSQGLHGQDLHRQDAYGQGPHGQGYQYGQGCAEENRRTVVLEEQRGFFKKKKGAYGGPGGGPRKPGLSGLKIFLIILGLCTLLVIISAVGCENSDDYNVSGPYIGTLYIEGTIQSGNVDSFGMANGYQHYWTLEQIDRMAGDIDNQGIILYINSPGGGVYESDELYLKLKEYQEITGNPVYTYMGAMAASGGYYIAAPSDKIFANRNTWTGSIGVTIGTLYDVSGFLNRYGIKTETLTSGANKAMGSAVDPLTDEQRAIWKSLINEAYDQFAGIVAEGRDIPIEQVKAIADGRIYSAKQALELGLVDKIGTFESAVRDMKMTYALRDCEVIDVVYHNNSFWGSILSGVFNAISPAAQSSEAGAVLSLLENQQSMPISYMFEWQK